MQLSALFLIYFVLFSESNADPKLPTKASRDCLQELPFINYTNKPFVFKIESDSLTNYVVPGEKTLLVTPEGYYQVSFPKDARNSFYRVKTPQRTIPVAAIDNTYSASDCSPAKKCQTLSAVPISEKVFFDKLMPKISSSIDQWINYDEAAPKSLMALVSTLLVCRQIPQMTHSIDEKMKQINLHLKEIEEKNGPFTKEGEQPVDVSL